MAVTYERRALTAPIITLELTGGPAAGELATSTDGQTVGGAETIARAQQITTNDAIGFVRLREIGSGTIVEDVPLVTEGTGNLRVVETVDSSLVRAGIVDFVDFITNCSKELLQIRIRELCGPRPNVDVLRRVKFTAVSRAIAVGAGVVINAAAFYYIRDLNNPFGG